MLNIVIPMSGHGSRFASEGFPLPKPLIPVHGKPMIELVVNNLRPRREHLFIFICQQAHVQKYDLETLLQKIAPNCQIVSIDAVTSGAACSVLHAREYIDNENPLMIANADQWIDIDINDYLQAADHNSDGTIMTMQADDPKWSYAALDENGFVTQVIEKEVISTHATVGIYNYRRGQDFCYHADKMITQNDRTNGEFYVAPVYNHFIKQNKAKVNTWSVGTVNNGMYGLGTPADYYYFLNSPVSLKAVSSV